MKKIFFAIGFFYGVSLCAQKQDSMKVIELENVAIIGSRASKLSPIPQTTVSRKDIQAIDFGQATANYLEKLSPSILSYSSAGSPVGNYNEFRMRGMNQTRMNITLNGIPLNDMMDQGVYFTNFSDLMSSIQRLQIQRGVGISSNGTSSYAGSLNMETIRPSQKNSGNIIFSFGSFRSSLLRLELGTMDLPHNSKVYVRYSQSKSDGYKNHSASKNKSFLFSLSKKLNKINSEVELVGFSGNTQNDQAYLPILISDIDNNPRTNYFSENDTDNYSQYMFQLHFKRYNHKNLHFSSILYTGGAEGVAPYYDNFSKNQTLYYLNNVRYGLSANIKWSLQKLLLFGGIHTYLFKRTNETSFSPKTSSPFYHELSSKEGWSVFAKAEYELIKKKLLLHADIQLRSIDMEFRSDTLKKYRSDEQTHRNELFLNPKIGITYQMDEYNNFYVMYGVNGREPTRNDLLQGNYNSAMTRNNVSAFYDPNVFKSEYVNDMEIGYRHSDEKTDIELNAFFMNFENEISAIGGFVQKSYIPLTKNLKKSKRYGCELSSRFKLQKNLNFSIQGTYLKTFIDQYTINDSKFSNREHTFSPNIIFSTSIKYAIKPNLQVNTEYRYVTDSYMELTNSASYIIPSSSVANVSLSWKPIKKLSFDLWLNNIFDTKYYTDGAPVDKNYDGTPEGPGYRIQPPRNLFLTCKIHL